MNADQKTVIWFGFGFENDNVNFLELHLKIDKEVVTSHNCNCNCTLAVIKAMKAFNQGNPMRNQKLLAFHILTVCEKPKVCTTELCKWC